MHRSSNFAHTDFACTAVDLAAGTATFIIKKHSQILAYAPDQVFSKHQISMSGLAAGTYEVSIMPPGSPNFVNHQGPGLTEADTCMIESPLALQIEVAVVGMGVGIGVPVLHLTSLPRMS
jgi:hypothetical protein